MANHYHNDQYTYSDPYTDRSGNQGPEHPGADFSTFPQTDYHTLPTLSYSTTMTDKKEGDPISTEQDSYVQRRQSNPYSVHSKQSSMDKSGGAAAEYYNSAPATTSNFVNSGAGAGDRLSKVDEEYNHGYGYGQHEASSNYGGYDDADKVKPFNDASNTSLVNNAAVPGKTGFHDMGTYPHGKVNVLLIKLAKLQSTRNRQIGMGTPGKEMRLPSSWQVASTLCSRGLKIRRGELEGRGILLSVCLRITWGVDLNAHSEGCSVGADGGNGRGRYLGIGSKCKGARKSHILEGTPKHCILETRCSCEIKRVACGKPDVGSFLICTYKSRSTIPALYEGCHRCAGVHPTAMSAPPPNSLRESILTDPLGMNNTANPPDRACSLESICGFGGFHSQDPNQWFRLVFHLLHHVCPDDLGP